MLDACMIIFLSFNFDPFGEPTSNDYVVLRSLLNCDFTTILPYMVSSKHANSIPSNVKDPKYQFSFFSFLDKIKLIFDIFILEEVNVKNSLSIWFTK